MRQALLFFTLCFLLFSCSKNHTDKQSFLQCDDPEHPDSTAISSKIEGSWILIKQRSGSTSQVVTPDKNIKVTFLSNKTYTVLEDSSVLSQGNWSLKIVVDSLWGLDFTAPSKYLTGYIAFCNNQLLFANSYQDGYDNLFKKAD